MGSMLRCSAIALLLVLSVHLGTASRLLVVPAPGATHQLQVALRLAGELAARSHEVMFISVSSDQQLVELQQQQDPSASKVKAAYYHPCQGAANATNAAAEEQFGEYKVWVKGLQAWYKNCESMLLDTQLLETLEAFKPSHVIGDSAFVCFGYLADMLNASKIALATTLMPPMEQTLYRMDTSIFEIPTFRSGLPHEMGLRALASNFMAHNSFVTVMKKSLKQMDKTIIGNLKINASRFGIADSLNQVHTLIVQAEPQLAAVPVILPPHVKLVGPIMAGSVPAAGPLPTPLQQLLDKAAAQQQGVVLGSFQHNSWSNPQKLQALIGSLVQSGMPVALRSPQEPVLQQLPDYKSLTKAGSNVLLVSGDSEVPAGVADNVFLLPDVLGHSAVRALVSDCRAAAVQQAAYFGVPLVCFPLRGDQIDHAQRVTERSIGITIPPAQQLNETFIQQALQAVSAQDSIYKQAAAAMSEVMRAHARAPVETAADIVENAIRRPAALAKLAAISNSTVSDTTASNASGNLVMTTAFIVGAMLMVLTSGLSQAMGGGLTKKGEAAAAAVKAAEAEGAAKVAQATAHAKAQAAKRRHAAAAGKS